MRKLTPKLKNLLVGLALLLMVGGVLASISVGTQLLLDAKERTVVVSGFNVPEAVIKAPGPLIDISYEDMRTYVFSGGEMLILKSPKYLQYLPDGTHMVATVGEGGVISATTINNSWNYFTIYLQEENIRLFRESLEKEKSKEERGYY